MYKLPVDAIHLAVYGGLGWTEIENEAKQQLDMSASRPVYIQSLQRLDAIGASNISWARVDRRERMNGASGLEVLDIRLYSSEGRAVLKIQGLEAGFTAMSQGTENDGIAVHSNAATTSAGAFVLESSFGESEKETVILSKEVSSASMAFAGGRSSWA